VFVKSFGSLAIVSSVTGMALAAFTFKLATAALPMPRTAKLDTNERREKTVPQFLITSSLIHRRAHVDTERELSPANVGQF
jgi:hypothetical protein